MKKQILIIIILIFFISIFVNPIILMRPVGNNINTKWDSYIEPGIFVASEEIDIKGMTYSLETYMWRDFMPISPPDGKPLIVVVRVYAFSEEDFPSSIKIERLWLINGDIIISTLSTDEYSINGNCLEMVFRDGPKWGPGIYIDVVVKLIETDFNGYYLKAVNQYIHGTV